MIHLLFPCDSTVKVATTTSSTMMEPTTKSYHSTKKAQEGVEVVDETFGGGEDETEEEAAKRALKNQKLLKGMASATLAVLKEEVSHSSYYSRSSC
jgi:hypothetical protein